MQISDYQNIAVITISHGNYVSHWIYQADKINPEKKHGWNSIALYLSVLQQTILYPETHKRTNGEDYHLYYIPLGNEMNIEKAKKMALQKHSQWRQPWKSFPNYVIRFLFRKKNHYPSEAQIFRKDYLQYMQYENSEYFIYYQQSVAEPLQYQKETEELIVCWHGSSRDTITQEVLPRVAEFWKRFRTAVWS
ncbi:MAG: hypothetical protein K2J71_01015 [Oscillospiraceae bacterium]|nr:hypothetical protein [Oscillospiraceae bacterium]